jgi:hypothetical protein
MKSKPFLTALFLINSCCILAQSPSGINYQSVVRNGNGQVLVNQSVALRISILQSAVNGTVVYQETHNATTNGFGLVNTVIGQGSNVTGSFSSINWGGNSHFVKTELDASGGTNFTELGTSQIMTVPYSFYSEEAGRLKGGSSAKTLIYTGGM